MSTFEPFETTSGNTYSFVITDGPEHCADGGCRILCTPAPRDGAPRPVSLEVVRTAGDVLVTSLDTGHRDVVELSRHIAARVRAARPVAVA